MDQYLERHKLPKLTHKETDNLNRTVFINKIESIINNLSKQKALGPEGEFYPLVNSTKHIRKKLYLFTTTFFRVIL